MKTIENVNAHDLVAITTVQEPECVEGRSLEITTFDVLIGVVIVFVIVYIVASIKSERSE